MFINRIKLSAQSIFLVFALFFLFSCRQQKSSEEDSYFKSADVKETLIKANRYLIRSEEEDIADFVRRYGWKMEKTGTGLRYAIDAVGSGDKARYGQLVLLDYKVMLLTGDVIYSSEEHGFKKFMVGRGGVETGLEEGILMLRKGDKAKFILPSHLAFGLLGDSEKIPPRTPIVYLIEVVDIQ